MKTIFYTFIFSISLLLSSCAFNINYPSKVKGEGEVITEEVLLDNFNALKLERGWEVSLVPSSSNSMLIEANENLFEFFEYENEAGILKVSSSKQITSADSKKITVYFTEPLTSIQTSSGTLVSSSEQLNFEDLRLELSSGSEVTLDLELNSLNLETSSGAEAYLTLNLDDLRVESSSGSSSTIDVNAISVRVESSSGADVVLKGSTSELEISTSSGADVNSKSLSSKTVIAKASSGASISVYPEEKLTAEVSSGGDVFYYNQPSGSLNVNKSKSGGSISKK
jgi:hypothetical protein